MGTENLETTEAQEVGVIETALQKANITKQVIAKLKADYSGLKINGIEDKEGFKKVEDARKDVKAHRVLASKICKAGREDAIKTQRDWIEKEKEVVGELDEIESALEKESDRIKAEKEAILFKAAQLAKLPARKEKLMTIGIEVADEELLKINDDQFTALFNDLHQKHLEAKAAALKAEQDRIEAEKREAQRIENERLAEEKRKAELLAAAENAKKEAEAKAKEAIEKAEKEKAEAEQRAREAESKAAAEKEAAILKAEMDKKAAIAEMERKQKEKELAEAKAKADEEARIEAEKQAAIEAELSKGDTEKFADLIVSLTALKTKYQFKSKKYQKQSATVNELIDKIIAHVTK